MNLTFDPPDPHGKVSDSTKVVGPSESTENIVGDWVAVENRVLRYVACGNLIILIGSVVVILEHFSFIVIVT